MLEGESTFIDQSYETGIELTKSLGSIYTIMIGFTFEAEDIKKGAQALISHGSIDC